MANAAAAASQSADKSRWCTFWKRHSTPRSIVAAASLKRSASARLGGGASTVLNPMQSAIKSVGASARGASIAQGDADAPTAVTVDEQLVMHGHRCLAWQLVNAYHR